MVKITTLALGVAVALGSAPAMAGRGGGGGGFHGGGGGFHGGGFLRWWFRLPWRVSRRLLLRSRRSVWLWVGRAGLGLAGMGLALLRTCLLSAAGVLRAASLLCASASRVSPATAGLSAAGLCSPGLRAGLRPRATRRVMRLLRSVMCRRPQACHLRTIHSRHTIRRPTPSAEVRSLSMCRSRRPLRPAVCRGEPPASLRATQDAGFWPSPRHQSARVQIFERPLHATPLAALPAAAMVLRLCFDKMALHRREHVLALGQRQPDQPWCIFGHRRTTAHFMNGGGPIAPPRLWTVSCDGLQHWEDKHRRVNILRVIPSDADPAPDSDRQYDAASGESRMRLQLGGWGALAEATRSLIQPVAL